MSKRAVGSELNLGKKVTRVLLLRHEAARPGRGVLNNRALIRQPLAVGRPHSMTEARIGDAPHDIGLNIVSLGQTGAAAVAELLHIDAFLVGRRVAVIYPEKSAYLHRISGHNACFTPLGRNIHRLTGAQVAHRIIAQILKSA